MALQEIPPSVSPEAPMALAAAQKHLKHKSCGLAESTVGAYKRPAQKLLALVAFGGPMECGNFDLVTRMRGRYRRIRILLDATDIIAFFSGIVALLFSIAMVAGWIPIDKYTVAIVTFAAAAPALANLFRATKDSCKSKGDRS